MFILLIYYNKHNKKWKQIEKVDGWVELGRYLKNADMKMVYETAEPDDPIYQNNNIRVAMFKRSKK